MGNLKVVIKKEESTSKAIKNVYDVKVGDVFCCRWGYEQTNVDYFQVVGLKGSTMIKIRQIASKAVETKENIGSMIRYVKSDKNNFVENENELYKKVLKYADRIFIKMNSYSNAYLLEDENISSYESSYS